MNQRLCRFLLCATLLLVNAAIADPATPHQGVKKPGTPDQYKKQIDQASQRWSDFPKLFLVGVLKVESRFDPGATSRTGAAGIAQFTTVACKEVQRLSRMSKYSSAFQKQPELLAQLQKFDQKLAYDPDIAIEASALYLEHLLRTYSRDLAVTATAYNAGTKAARAVLEHGFDSALEQGLLTFSQASTYWPHVRDAMESYGAKIPNSDKIPLTVLAVKSSRAHFRDKPGGKKLMKAPKSLKFVILSQKSRYFEIDCAGQKLWIKSRDCKRHKKAKVARIQTETLNVRKGPGTVFEIVGKLKRGQRMVIVDQKAEWLKIQFGLQQAWIFSGKSYVKTEVSQ